MAGADRPGRDHTTRKRQSSSYPASLKPSCASNSSSSSQSCSMRTPHPPPTPQSSSIFNAVSVREGNNFKQGPHEHPQPLLIDNLPKLALLSLLSGPGCSHPPAPQPYRNSLGEMTTPPPSYETQPWINWILWENAVRYQLVILQRVTQLAASWSSPLRCPLHTAQRRSMLCSSRGWSAGATTKPAAKQVSRPRGQSTAAARQAALAEKELLPLQWEHDFPVLLLGPRSRSHPSDTWPLRGNAAHEPWEGLPAKAHLVLGRGTK